MTYLSRNSYEASDPHPFIRRARGLGGYLALGLLDLGEGMALLGPLVAESEGPVWHNIDHISVLQEVPGRKTLPFANLHAIDVSSVA